MFQYLWPIGLVIASNTMYHICAKSVPKEASAFFAVFIAYVVGATLSIILFFMTKGESTFMKEVSMVNWASIVLGICVVGLEFGYMTAYKVGWNISIASLVGNMVVALLLVIVGVLAYKEVLTMNQVIGIVLCSGGLFMLNK